MGFYIEELPIEPPISERVEPGSVQGMMTLELN
jgi:hypothetical protein